jgi:hypothetical protein
MRRLAPLLLCLVVLFAAAYSRPGYTQNRRKTTTRAKPKPTPISDEPDSFEGLPRATPTPKSDENVLDLLPEETPEPPSEWELILFQNHIAYYYNTRRITRPTPGVVKVWLKWWRFKEQKKEYIRQMSGSGHDYKWYSYSLHLAEYDCKGFRWRLRSIIEYTIFDEAIESLEGSGEWVDIVPESIGESILEAVCREKS